MGMAVALQPLRGTKGFYDNSHPPTLIELTRPNSGSGLRAYLHYLPSSVHLGIGLMPHRVVQT